MQSLSLVGTIAAHTLRQQWKDRFLQLVVIFGGILVYAALLAGVLAVDAEQRALMDFGLALAELVGLAAVLFGCSSSILRDMETKNIYLLLSRPVPRWTYLVGKYAGIVASAGLALLVMGGVHVSLLLIKGYGITVAYPQILLACWLKLVVIGSLTVLLSLVSTSVLSALVMSGIFWTLGHFVPELKFIGGRMTGVGGWLSKAVAFLLPDLSMFNLKDSLFAAAPAPSWGLLFLYAFSYALCALALSSALFAKKEF